MVFTGSDADTNEEYGPFASLLEAVQDMEYNAESDYEPGETVEEAEEELGISDWIDPDTGEPGRGISPPGGVNPARGWPDLG
jgi:hypothetical protein